MKMLIKLTWLSIILMFCSFTVSAQDKPRKTTTIEVLKPFNLNEYKDWKKFELKGIFLYLPKEFKLEKFMGIDGGGWRYKSPAFTFFISSGWVQDAPLISDRKRPHYKEKFARINNQLVRMWFYENKAPQEPFANYPYFGQIAFNDPVTKGNKYAITLWSKESNGLELLNKVLESIKLK